MTVKERARFFSSCVCYIPYVVFKGDRTVVNNRRQLTAEGEDVSEIGSQRNDQTVFLTWRMGDVAGRKEAAPHCWSYLLLFCSLGNIGSWQKLKAALTPAT